MAEELRPAPRMTKEQRLQLWNENHPDQAQTPMPSDNEKFEAWKKKNQHCFQTLSTLRNFNFYTRKSDAQKHGVLYRKKLEFLINLRNELKQKDRQQYIDTVFKYRMEFGSIPNIAKAMKSSRERVRLTFRQLEKNPATAESMAVIARQVREMKKQRKMKTLVCQQCEKQFLSLVKNKYCSKRCQKDSITIWKAPDHCTTTKQRRNWLYNNNPAYKVMQTAKTKKALLKRLSDPAKKEELLAKQRVYLKIYYDKKKLRKQISTV